jgi:hypothetical protein
MLLERINEVSAADIFNANTQLHEAIAECSATFSLSIRSSGSIACAADGIS